MGETMACEPMKTTATAAKCGKSCSGAPSAAGNGCRPGLRVLRSPEVELQPITFEPMPLPNGPQATGVSPTTGAERCVRCMVGQGKGCDCSAPVDVDPGAARWVLFGLIAFLGIVGALVRGCAA